MKKTITSGGHMIAKLEFNLDEPYEREAHMMALRGSSYKSALDEMNNYLRGRLKYEELPESVTEALQAARDHLNSLIREVEE